MKDKGDAGNSFQQRLSAPPTDKGVYSSRGSISPGNWGQLLFVCIASPSLGATISLAHDGVSLVSFITTAGSAEDTYERNPEQGAPARREPWNVDNNST